MCSDNDMGADHHIIHLWIPRMLENGIVFLKQYIMNIY